MSPRAMKNTYKMLQELETKNTDHNQIKVASYEENHIIRKLKNISSYGQASPLIKILYKDSTERK